MKSMRQVIYDMKLEMEKLMKATTGEIRKEDSNNKKGNYKYYGVISGRTCGVFSEWVEVCKSINGFKGALWKGFYNRREAYDFLEDNQIDQFGERFVDKDVSLMSLKDSKQTIEYQKSILQLINSGKITYYEKSGLTIRAWLDTINKTCAKFIIDTESYAPVIGHLIKVMLPACDIDVVTAMSCESNSLDSFMARVIHKYETVAQKVLHQAAFLRMVMILNESFYSFKTRFYELKAECGVDFDDMNVCMQLLSILSTSEFGIAIKHKLESDQRCMDFEVLWYWSNINTFWGPNAKATPTSGGNGTSQVGSKNDKTGTFITKGYKKRMKGGRRRNSGGNGKENSASIGTIGLVCGFVRSKGVKGGNRRVCVYLDTLSSVCVVNDEHLLRDIVYSKNCMTLDGVSGRSVCVADSHGTLGTDVSKVYIIKECPVNLLSFKCLRTFGYDIEYCNKFDVFCVTRQGTNGRLRFVCVNNVYVCVSTIHGIIGFFGRGTPVSNICAVATTRSATAAAAAAINSISIASPQLMVEAEMHEVNADAVVISSGDSSVIIEDDSVVIDVIPEVVKAYVPLNDVVEAVELSIVSDEIDAEEYNDDEIEDSISNQEVDEDRVISVDEDDGDDEFVYVSKDELMLTKFGESNAKFRISTATLNRAKLMREVHEKIIGHGGRKVTVNFLTEHDLWDLTVSDWDMCEELFGKCMDCESGKAVNVRNVDGLGVRSKIPLEVVHMDLKFLDVGKAAKATCLVGVCEAIGKGWIFPIEGKSSAAVLYGISLLRDNCTTKAVRRIKKICALGAVYSDSEPNFISLKSELTKLGIESYQSPPGTHSNIVERYIQTVQCKVLSVNANFFRKWGVYVPKQFNVYMWQDMISNCNRLSNSSSGNKSPNSIIGSRYPFRPKLAIGFGDICMCGVPSKKKTSDCRDVCVQFVFVLGRHENDCNSYFVYDFKSGEKFYRSYGMTVVTNIDGFIRGCLNALEEKCVDVVDDNIYKLEMKEYSVKNVLAWVRNGKNLLFYLVQWEGFSQLTWEPRVTLQFTDKDLKEHGVPEISNFLFDRDNEEFFGRVPEFEGNVYKTGLACVSICGLAGSQVESVTDSAELRERCLVGVESGFADLFGNESGVDPVKGGLNEMPLRKALAQYPEQTKVGLLSELKCQRDLKTMQPVVASSLSTGQRKGALSKFFFAKHKYNPLSGDYERTKVRGVVNGSQQPKNEVLKERRGSPVMRYESMCALLGIVANRNLSLGVADVTCAYMHTPMPSDLVVYAFIERSLVPFYLEMNPEWRPFVDPISGGLYVVLLKAMPGMRESGMLWYQLAVRVASSVGWKVFSSNVERAVMSKTDEYGIVCYLGLNVDDFLIAGSDEIIDEFVTVMESKFGKLKLDKGDKLAFAGIQITRNRANRSIELSQHIYLSDLLLDFHGRGIIIKESKTLAVADLFKLHTAEGDSLLKKELNVPFISDLMSVWWLARTRPGIEVVLSYLATRVWFDCPEDVAVLYKLVGFLMYTRDYVKVLSPKSFEIFVSIDVSFGCHGNGSSHTGVIVSMGRDIESNHMECVIHSGSTKQGVVVKSSTEGELVGLSDKVDVGIWLKYFLSECGILVGKIIVYQDNESTIGMAVRGYGSFSHTKHVNMKNFYVTSLINQGIISLEGMGTKLMVSDVNTKVKGGKELNFFINCIMNRERESSVLYVQELKLNALDKIMRGKEDLVVVSVVE